MSAKKKTSMGSLYAVISKPVFSKIVRSNKHYGRQYLNALMYAQTELTSAALKKEVVTYLKSLDISHPLLEKIKNIHENRLAVIGKYMYILNHGGELPEKVLPTVIPSLEKIIDEEEQKASQDTENNKARTIEKESVDTEDSGATKTVITIQDRLKEKAQEVAGEVEGWLDDLILDKKSSVKTVDEFVGLLKSNNLKGPHMKFIQQSFSRRFDHSKELVESRDKELLDGYSNFTKPELKKLLQFYQNLFTATEMLQEAAKVVRAPRKKKPVSQEKLVSKLKYKKEDTALGIVSLNPVEIIGAKELWVYNTKTRKLAQYKSMDTRGLLVKGASIDNFSSESAEKTLRKPAETIAEFKKASKIKLRTFLKEISTVDVPAQGRLNEHHIILRIDK
jgi:hypothetical protein